VDSIMAYFGLYSRQEGSTRLPRVKQSLSGEAEPVAARRQSRWVSRLLAPRDGNLMFLSATGLPKFSQSSRTSGGSGRATASAARCG
jgi:hypothetical protein